MIPSPMFYAQFALKYDSYRDSNNFIRQNHVQTRDRRYLNLFQKNEFDFFDIIGTAPWYGEALTHNLNVSLDGGKTYQYQNRKLFVGMYYFNSNMVLEFDRTVYSIETMLCDLGGMLSLSLTIIPLIFAISTERFKLAKVIQHVFSSRM